MAGSQTPTTPRKQRPVRKVFSLDEANRTLPLVSRIVRDVVEMHAGCAQVQARIETADPREVPALQERLELAVDRLHDLVDELSQVGVLLKDYEIGLVDFPARHEDRDVYLCWRLGEAEVGFWHELHAGYGGRQPIQTFRP